MSETATLLKRIDHVCACDSEACDELETKIMEDEHKVHSTQHRTMFKRLEAVQLERKFFTGPLLSQD
jgi:hypothetical protein